MKKKLLVLFLLLYCLGFEQVNAQDAKQEAVKYEQGLSEFVKLYPNPVGDVLHVKSDLPIVRIEIYSIVGRKLIEVKSDFYNIPLDHLPSDLYMIKIFTKESYTVKKLIKR